MTNLLLVGCGKMGSALLQRMAGHTVTHVVDPAVAHSALVSLPGVSWHPSLEDVDPDFSPDIIVLAVKPQHMADALPAYARYKSGVFLSIAAGQAIARLASLLGGERYAIVRSMPNLPANVGQSMTVAIANKNVSPDQRASCDKLLNVIGDVAWVQEEALLDAVTALSGSGPAYVFALAEAMAKAGEKLGLSSELAARLARQTIVGSGALLAQSDESATGLRKAVTSPGGTTEAALNHLLAEHGLDELMVKAMTAAAQRAKELAK